MPGTSDGPHSKYRHVYAIVRFDLEMSRERAAAVVKVIPSQELAEKETARLNAVNKGKQCTYKVQTSRFVESPET